MFKSGGYGRIPWVKNFFGVLKISHKVVPSAFRSALGAKGTVSVHGKCSLAILGMSSPPYINSPGSLSFTHQSFLRCGDSQCAPVSDFTMDEVVFR